MATARDFYRADDDALTTAVDALRELYDGDPCKTWEFACECERLDCHEVVVLTLAEYEAVRERRDLVLAPQQSESRFARARRLGAAARADSRGLNAQAAHQVRRALKNILEEARALPRSHPR